MSVIKRFSVIDDQDIILRSIMSIYVIYVIILYYTTILRCVMYYKIDECI